LDTRPTHSPHQPSSWRIDEAVAVHHGIPSLASDGGIGVACDGSHVPRRLRIAHWLASA
jgi:hypothetical protein